MDLDAWMLVLPRELRGRALEESHSEPQSGHFGNDKTFRRVSSKYYWPGIFQDVVGFDRACDICQKSKVEQAKPVGLMGHRTVEQPWTVVAGDVMGPFSRSKSGHKYILVWQDLFTKWIECLPICTANGPIVRKAFEGPFKIKICLSPVVYTLVTSDGKFAVKEHIRNLKPVTSSIVARHILPSFIVCRSLHTSRKGRGKFPPLTGSPFHKARNAKPLKGRNASTGRQFTEEQRSLHSSNQSGLSTSGFPHARATGTTRDIFS